MTHTLQVDVGRPVPFNMGNDPFSASVETGVVGHADASAGGIEIVKSGR